jgi:hypothetical protein
MFGQLAKDCTPAGVLAIMSGLAMRTALRLSSPIALLFIGACVSMPSGPDVLVLPGTGKNFDQFRSDDAVCRQYAFEQVGGASPNTIASDSGVRSAAVGTVLGAAAGAAINGGRGAAVGAGTGLAIGGLAGTGTAESSRSGLQQRYDTGYVQCMYAHGNRVPVSGRMTSSLDRRREFALPPPPGTAPPRQQ